MLAGFAGRWLAANDSTLGFDKEQCHHFVYAVVLLNASRYLGHLHQGLPSPTLWAWFARVTRYMIKEELPEDIYGATRQGRLRGPKDFFGHRGTRGASHRFYFANAGG